MRFCVYYKEGVLGDFSPELGRGFRKVKRLAAYLEDIYVTCLAGGSHSMATFHNVGRNWSDAVDFRPLKKVRIEDIRKTLGKKFQIIDETSHWHLERDFDD